MTVRDQVLEVIVRQALAGAPWREICAGPMRVNHITEEEVEREVDRRINGYKHALSEDEQAHLSRYTQGWNDRLSAQSCPDLNEQVEDLIVRFYQRHNQKPPSAIVLCKSPWQFLYCLESFKLSRFDERELLSRQSEAFTLRWSTVSKFDQRKQLLASALAEHSGAAQPDRYASYLIDCLLEIYERTGNDPGEPRTKWFDNEFKSVSPAMEAALSQCLGADIKSSLNLSVANQMSAALLRLGLSMNVSFNAARDRIAQLGREETDLSTTRLTDRFRLAALDRQSMDNWQISLRLGRQADAELVMNIWSISPLISYGFAHRHLRNKLSLDPDLETQFGMWIDLFEAAPWYSFFENVCFVGTNPDEIVLDERRRLSNRNGPAVTFADGSRVWAIDGIAVPRKLVENPSDIKAVEIENEGNVAIRRIMLETYGAARFLLDAQAELIHKDDYGELYRKELADEEPLVMVCVTNKTMEADGSHVRYFLRVPPDVRTAKEAVAWTFQQSVAEYNPEIET